MHGPECIFGAPPESEMCDTEQGLGFLIPVLPGDRKTVVLFDEIVVRILPVVSVGFRAHSAILVTTPKSSPVRLIRGRVVRHISDDEWHGGRGGSLCGAGNTRAGDTCVAVTLRAIGRDLASPRGREPACIKTP